MSAQPRWDHTEDVPRPVEVPARAIRPGSDRNAVRILTVIALTSIAAGAIHVAAAATLGRNSTQNLAFFGVVAVAETVWGLVSLARAPRWWLALGVLGNAVVVAIWVASRTVGVPFGQYAGDVFPAKYPDVLATLFGVATILGAAALAIRGSGPVRAAARARNFALAAAIVIGALALTGVVSQANASTGGGGGGGQNTPTAPTGGGGAYGGGGYGGY
jgi:uncharacterized membrane protein YgcG